LQRRRRRRRRRRKKHKRGCHSYKCYNGLRENDLREKEIGQTRVVKITNRIPNNSRGLKREERMKESTMKVKVQHHLCA
jgi:hypothetical protein